MEAPSPTGAPAHGASGAGRRVTFLFFFSVFCKFSLVPQKTFITRNCVVFFKRLLRLHCQKG